MKNKNDLVIQKAGKCNGIIILNKDSCLKSVETLLKVLKNFKTFLQCLNYVFNSEKEVTDLLKKLYNKNPSSEGTYNKPTVAKPEQLMDQLKRMNPSKID